MVPDRSALKQALEYALPWLVLAALLAYTYAHFFRHPYGLRWEGNGTVSHVFVHQREPAIHEGDRLLKVGSISFDQFASDLSQDLFEGARPGQLLPVTVQRGAQTLVVEWRVPGSSPAELQNLFFTPWFLAFFFWLTGTATLVSLRPKDMRWFLLAAFSYITAFWIIAGSGLASFQIWYSALVVRSLVWLSVPIYLHLHWVFPKPLGKLSPIITGSVYGAFAAVAVLQWLQLLPRDLYILGLLLAILGSLILLVMHALRQPEMRRDLILLLVAAVLAIAPLFAMTITGSIRGSSSPAATVGLLSLPILPFAYLYAAYRRQLGGLELRVNRLISLYTFLILLGAVVIPVLVLIHRSPLYTADQLLITGFLISVAVAILSLWGYPRFQGVLERRLFGIAVPGRELQQTYAEHITSSTSFAALTRLLSEDILPSLLIRQFVFIALDDGNARVLLSKSVSEEQVPAREARALLPALVGKRSTAGLLKDPRYRWIRLVLPLRVQDALLGFWLFGRRDPDDIYSHLEIPVLQLFANQAAIALSNILQTERLRAMYQADIDRQEEERRGLARDLHDSVLSELAGMLMNADMANLPKNFQDGYRALTEHLRAIVSYLRPPMLNYGLKLAIEELADNIMERSNDAFKVEVDIESTGDRYPIDKEQHLFRIVQQACDNAIQHSHGNRIVIYGRLVADSVHLVVEDNGRGFVLPRGQVHMYDLLSQRHFGLAGMLERAELINAVIAIHSSPGAGTRVDIDWYDQHAPAQGPGDFSS